MHWCLPSWTLLAFGSSECWSGSWFKSIRFNWDSSGACSLVGTSSYVLLDKCIDSIWMQECSGLQTTSMFYRSQGLLTSVTSSKMCSNLHVEGLVPTCERMTTFSKDLNLDAFLFYCNSRSDPWTHGTFSKGLGRLPDRTILSMQHLDRW